MVEKDSLGRKKSKIWWKTKLEVQAAKIAELEESLNVRYAAGFYECMAKYGIMSKLQRRKVRERLEKEGPGAIKSLKRSYFGVPIPSI